MVADGCARDHRGIPESTDPATRPLGGAATTETPSGCSPNGHWGPWLPRPLGAFPTVLTVITLPTWSPRSHGRWPHGRHPRHHLRHMRRSSDGRVLAGICAGISQATGIDVTILRIGFVLVGLASGIPVLIYALAWLIVPLDDETTNIFSRAINDRRGHPPGHRRHPGRDRNPDRGLAPPHQLRRDHQLAGVPGRRADHLDLAQRQRARAGVDATTTSSRCSASGAKGGAGRWKLILRVTAGAALAAGGHRGAHHGPPEHRRPATARRRPAGHRRHRDHLRTLVAQPGPRPDVGARGAGRWPRSGRRWRRTCTTRCCRRWP